MSTNNKVRGVTIAQLLANLISGVNESFPSGSSLVIDGVNYDQAGLVQKLQGLTQPAKKAEDLRTQATHAVKERDEALPATRNFLVKVISGFEYLHGSDPNLISQLGVPAEKMPRALTSAEKTARAAKAQATRDLRGTKGSRQKASVKAVGNVQVTATMPSSAPSPAPAPSPTSPAAATTGPQEVNGAAH